MATIAIRKQVDLHEPVVEAHRKFIKWKSFLFLPIARVIQKLSLNMVGSCRTARQCFIPHAIFSAHFQVSLNIVSCKRSKYSSESGSHLFKMRLDSAQCRAAMMFSSHS